MAEPTPIRAGKAAVLPPDVCPKCGGTEHRVFVVVNDSHFVRKLTGEVTLGSTYALPIPVPCECIMDRANKVSRP